MLRISEIFRSIQGESTYQGWPCTFIRLAGCNLDCSYCDTQYAKNGHEEFSIKEVLGKVKDFSNKGFVEITGGEPLLQSDVVKLGQRLLAQNYTVLLETNGSLDISNLDKRIIKVIDIKCPSSGESEKVHWPNLGRLDKKDQVKFVLGNEEDYHWAKKVIADYSLENRCQVLLSAVWNQLNLKTVADWILKDNLQVTLQPQLHKIIWGPDRQGV